MSRQSQPSFIAWRFYLVIGVIVVASLGLAFRIFDLTILDQHFLRHQGNERVLRMVSTPALRGMINDRNDSPLAVSTRVYSVWINPKEFNAKDADIKHLAEILEIEPAKIKQTFKHGKKRQREFSYLKRGVPPHKAQAVKELKLHGLHTNEELKRYYPEGEVTAHVVGFTNIDDIGQEGLELAYNKWLQGEPGKKWVIRDRLGRTISEVQTVSEQKTGKDLTLSIDKRIQYLAYRELLNAVVKNKAESGSAIVLDAHTGEVLAMVNQPSFNPNNRSTVKQDTLRNRSVTDLFEPGSTIKAFSVASALDSGKYDAETIIDTYPGWMRVDHNVVKDEHNNGKLSVREVMQISSNVGVTKMTLSLPPDQLWGLLHRVGFGEITGVGFPGEQGGSLVRHYPWGDFTLATLGFGYGLSVTALQLARAYQVLANDGIKTPVTLLKAQEAPKGERVMSHDVASAMVELLESVVQKGGTGRRARVPGYRVAGKTGTAIKAGQHGYKEKRYVSSFVGLAPLTNPRLVVAVVVNNPQGKYHYGGSVCGPVFSNIMAGSLRLLGVPLDDPLNA